MRIAMFYHSLVSDWNHGNAHFLRGVVWELRCRGHEVRVYEPEDGWSFRNLAAEHGYGPIRDFHRVYPGLRSTRYSMSSPDFDRLLDGVDLAMVHEWNDHELVTRIGAHRASGGICRLLFHDTHHRSVTDREAISAYDLRRYDGVLAFGSVIRDVYLAEGWAERAWTWHEAADTRIFHPNLDQQKEGDLVWIGNWGDDERTAELKEFLIEPVRTLRLRACVHGVRYPAEARQALSRAGITYAGWLPNYAVPEVFSRYRVTVHIPRRPYVEALPGIPTIRVFEALACGIPLVSSPWEDSERLFTPGKDYLVARNGEEMKRHLSSILNDEEMAGQMAAHGLQTILSKHTCAHRVDELLSICRTLGLDTHPEGNATCPPEE